MRKIFLYHSNHDAIDIISTYIKTQFGIDVVTERDFSTATSVIKAWEFSLIITIDKDVDTEGREVNCAKQLLNIISDAHMETKVIVLGNVELSFGNFSLLPREVKIDDIAKEVVKLLNITREEVIFIKKPDFLAVPIQNFYQLNNPCTDIYIRIKKQDGDQFVKRINAEEEIDKNVIKKYESMNLSELYLKKEDYDALMNQILSQSMKRVVEAHKSNEGILEVSSDSFEISQNLIDQMGITPGTVKMAKTSIKSMMKTVSSNVKVSTLLKEIVQNESSFSYKRSYLISLFAFQIMPNLGWGRGDQLNQNLEKIVFVSFFHDAFLRDEKLIRIMSNEDLEKAQLTGAEKTLVLEHANKASTLVQSIPLIPGGIDVIIRQHHGTNNGVGFMSHVSAGVSPMAVVFIVIEDFSHQILESIYNKQKLSLSDILKSLEAKYTLPSFRKVLELLKNLMSK